MLARLMAPPILALALLAAPLTAETQPAGKIPRIGYLSTGSAAWNPFVEAFRQGLRETGWIEGQNILVLRTTMARILAASPTSSVCPRRCMRV